VSLGVVIGLMWAAATMLRRRGLTPAGGRRPTRGVQVEMLARRPLGRNASIAVVRIGERSIVLGITDHQVTKLDDADIDEIDLEEAGANWTAPQGSRGLAPVWKTMLDQMRNRTVRR
jgi:flagellar protein FliO/FliZ